MEGLALRFPFESLPQLLAAILLLALIIVLLRVRGSTPVNRSLALFFGATAAFNIIATAANAQTDAYHWAVLSSTWEAIGVADGILLIGFAAAYFTQLGALRRGPWSTPLPYAVASVAVIALGCAFPFLVRDYSPAVGYASVDAIPGSLRFPRGPLHLVDAVLDLAWIIVPAILAHRALTRDDGTSWRSSLLLATAIATVFAAFDAATIFYWGAKGWPTSSIEQASTALTVVRLALLAALIAYLVWRAAAGRVERRRAAAASTLALLTAATIGIALAYASMTSRPLLAGVLNSLIFLLEPLVVAYAVLRHQLLDIDVKIKVGISRGTLAGVFLGTFFVAAQVAEGLLSAQYGVLFGGAAAGLLLFALAPLQRFGERVADKAMPRTGRRADLTSKERAYKNALRIALVDRVVTREEELQLAHLADELGLSTQAAIRLRHEVEGEASGQAGAA